MQGDLKEIEMRALRIKLDKEEYLKKVEKEKRRQEFAEQQKFKEEKVKSEKFKDKLKLILAVVIFAGIVALHIALSLLQRDYTGVEISFRKYVEGVFNTSKINGVTFTLPML